MLIKTNNNTKGDNPLFLGLASLAAVVTVHIAVKTYKKRRDAHKYPPVAPASMLETIAKMSADDLPWFLLATAKHLDSRTFQLSLPLPFPMVVAVGDGQLAREILTDKASTKPPALYDDFNSITANVPTMFSTNGDYWHSRRKGIAPAFANNQVNRMNSVAVKTADRWIENMLTLEGQEKGFQFDVADEMIDLMLTSICQTAFEYQISENEKGLFLLELKLALKEFLFKSSTNPLRKMFGIFLKERRRAFLAARRLQEFSLKIIDVYSRLSNPLKGTMIDLIMNNPCYTNDLERAADVTTLLVGGHDTTAYSLAWTLKELARKPELQTQLREDLRKAGDGHNNARDASERLFDYIQ